MDTKTKQLTEQDKIDFGITKENLRHFIENNKVKVEAVLEDYKEHLLKSRPQINERNLELFKRLSDNAGVNVDDNSFNVFLKNMLERELKKEGVPSKNKCSRCGKHNLLDEEASLCEECDDELTREQEGEQ